MKKIIEKITLEVLDERLTNFFRENKEDHNSLIAQTTKTNGRVNKLELWQNRIIGGMIIVDIIVVPVAIYLFTKIV